MQDLSSPTRNWTHTLSSGSTESSPLEVPRRLCFLICIYVYIWLCWVLVAARGFYFPDQGSNPGPLHWALWVSVTGPPGKSPNFSLYGHQSSWIKTHLHDPVTFCGPKGQGFNIWMWGYTIQPIIVSFVLWFCWFEASRHLTGSTNVPRLGVLSHEVHSWLMARQGRTPRPSRPSTCGLLHLCSTAPRKTKNMVANHLGSERFLGKQGFLC